MAAVGAEDTIRGWEIDYNSMEEFWKRLKQGCSRKPQYEKIMEATDAGPIIVFVRAIQGHSGDLKLDPSLRNLVPFTSENAKLIYHGTS